MIYINAQTGNHTVYDALKLMYCNSLAITFLQTVREIYVDIYFYPNLAG